MKSIIFIIFLLFIYVDVNADVWQPSSEHTQMAIWPEGKTHRAGVKNSNHEITKSLYNYHERP